MIVVEGVPKAIVHHGVHELRLTHGVTHAIAVAALLQSKGCHVHVLGATCDNDIGIAGLDHLCGGVNRIETGAADDVDRDGRALDWKARVERCLAGDVLALPRLKDTAQVDVIDVLGLDLRTVQGLLDDRRAERTRRDCGQRTAKLSDGGTTCACDNDSLTHVANLLDSHPLPCLYLTCYLA